MAERSFRIGKYYGLLTSASSMSERLSDTPPLSDLSSDTSIVSSAEVITLRDYNKREQFQTYKVS